MWCHPGKKQKHIVQLDFCCRFSTYAFICFPLFSELSKGWVVFNEKGVKFGGKLIMDAFSQNGKYLFRVSSDCQPIFYTEISELEIFALLLFGLDFGATCQSLAEASSVGNCVNSSQYVYNNTSIQIPHPFHLFSFKKQSETQYSNLRGAVHDLT